MSTSPYAWDEHEPGCRCRDCNVVVPFRRPTKPGVPPHIRAQLAELKAKWRAQRLAEARETRALAVQFREFDELHARALERMAQERADPGRWLPAWAVQEQAEAKAGKEDRGGHA